MAMGTTNKKSAQIMSCCLFDCKIWVHLAPKNAMIGYHILAKAVPNLQKFFLCVFHHSDVEQPQHVIRVQYFLYKEAKQPLSLLMPNRFRW